MKRLGLLVLAVGLAIVVGCAQEPAKKTTPGGAKKPVTEKPTEPGGKTTEPGQKKAEPADKGTTLPPLPPETKEEKKAAPPSEEKKAPPPADEKKETPPAPVAPKEEK